METPCSLLELGQVWAREKSESCGGFLLPWRRFFGREFGMATPGRNQRRLELHVVFLLLFLFANLSHAVLENSSMVWRYAGEEPSLVASVTSPQEYSSKLF